MICKVQRDLDTGRRVLIYSRDRRKVFFEGLIHQDLIDLMGDATKIFVEGHVDEMRHFVITGRAPWQEW
jgi:hypothetical protein